MRHLPVALEKQPYGLQKAAISYEMAYLKAHHREAGVAESDGKLRPDVARRRMRAGEEREQGRKNE